MHGRKKLPPDLSRPRSDVERNSPEWDAWITEIEQYLGFKVCGACNSRKCPCPSPPMRGRTRCRQHGGATPRGPASANWRTGKTSLYADLLPERMAATFEQVVTDPKLLALETDIALLEMRQLELVQAIRDGTDPAAALRSARDHLADLSTAVAEGNVVNIGMAAEEISNCIEAGLGTADTWSNFMRTGEQKRKLVESEGKRLERMQAFLTVEEARARDQMLISILIRAVQGLKDPHEARKLLSSVMQEVAVLSGMQPTRTPDPAQLPAHLQVNP